MSQPLPRLSRQLIRPGRVPLLLVLALLAPQCVRVRMSDQKVAAYFTKRPVKPTLGFVTTGRQRVHYASLEADPPGADSLPMVLFIHGSPGSWDAFIEFFSDSGLYRYARLVAVDRPGFGQSGLGRAEPSLAAQATALVPLLRQSTARHKPILVGHSLGGPVAVRLAMDYPDAVGGLVLVAPSISPDLEPQEWFRPVLHAFPLRCLVPVELRVSNEEILPLKKELTAMLPGWANIRVPVTIIHGEADALVPPGNAAFGKKMLVNAPVTIRMMPGMNHFIPWRRPDTIREAILNQLIAN